MSVLSQRQYQNVMELPRDAFIKVDLSCMAAQFPTWYQHIKLINYFSFFDIKTLKNFSIHRRNCDTVSFVTAKSINLKEFD